MKFELFMSLRYLKAKRKQTFISLITWISILGVAVGVMALIVVLSVMTGMQNEVRDKILGTYSHIVALNSLKPTIRDSDEMIKKIESNPHVKAAAPYIHKEVMVSSLHRSAGAVLRGLDPSREGKVTSIDKYMLDGITIKVLDTQYEDGEFLRNGVILGDEMAAQLGVLLGDNVNIISPMGRKSPMGLVPRIEKFHVAGLFHSGMFEYDSGMALLSIKSAQRFFGMNGRVSGIGIKVDDIYTAGDTAAELEKSLGSPYYARDWMEMNESFFFALKLEKAAIFIVLVLIVFVAAFNIISTMIMVVMEKGRDIAILKAMGATRKTIKRIFLLEGVIIGVLGTVIGNILGFITCIALDKYDLIKIPSDIYNVPRLTVEMNFFDFALVTACALVITTLSAIYPAHNASRLDPAEALRYE